MATGNLRVVVLWHMHQPFYKDLVTGDYRLPWVRLHAMKDYYGMVKLLDEFPEVHQNFNLVPSLVEQIRDYASESFHDTFYDIAAKPAADLTPEERRFALQYLFHANPDRMIGRYARYRELYERVRVAGPDPARAAVNFTLRDYTDLQVLSQIAWMDEYYLQAPEIRELVRKGRGFTHEDQKLVMRKELEIIERTLPAYEAAAKRGGIEISTTPYYHPILPLLCDTNAGAASSPGLPLPRVRFRHPEDASDQIRRAMDSHEQIFGIRPKGMWPSEGSVSDEAVAIAAANGVEWMATDEGVLSRSLNFNFQRDGERLRAESAATLYNIYQYEKDGSRMKMIFRDHRMSDMIGFVYAGMPAKEAAAHLLNNIKSSAAPVLESGRDAVVPIILDGENAWETFPESGREFLRRFYEGLQNDPAIEPVTISEAIERHSKDRFGKLTGLVPGSWINANFNVWIGAREDNRAWEYLAEARDYYDANASKVKPEQQELAYEELLIAEGSDWNWWYGPEHHSANDRDFDELYRKHLSNVYQALGGVPPEHLARPIAAGVARPMVVPQTAFVRPQIDGYATSYFDWMGAAMFTSDQRGGSMHGKQFLLDAAYAGVDEANVYGRLDFASSIDAKEWQIAVQFSTGKEGAERQTYRLEMQVREAKLDGWVLTQNGKKMVVASSEEPKGVEAAMQKLFEFKMPFELIGAELESDINMRFVAIRDGLPLDALPVEGSLDLKVQPEEELAMNAYSSAGD